MPDGPNPTGPDFYAWTQYQAEVLRSLATIDNRFDRAHVAAEIEDLGKSERNAVRSEIRRILEHFLQLAHSPAVEPRPDWMVSIANARAGLADKIAPTLPHDAGAGLPRLYMRARRIAALGPPSYGEASEFAPTCPYTLDQVLSDDWYPGDGR